MWISIMLQNPAKMQMIKVVALVIEEEEIWEVEEQEVSKEEVVAITLTKKETTILDHQVKEEAKILGFLVEEEDEVIITKKEIILNASNVGDLDIKQQIA